MHYSTASPVNIFIFNRSTNINRHETVGISTYNWWTRRNVPDFLPSRLNAGLSMFALGGLMYSGFLGGVLVYKYGYGVQRQGDAPDVKRDWYNATEKKHA